MDGYNTISKFYLLDIIKYLLDITGIVSFIDISKIYKYLLKIFYPKLQEVI